MNQENKKYTVYEIEKLTKGRLTKYKLTKAILAGELKAQKVKEKKRGRGIPNFFIYEEDLNSYLKQLEANKKHFINIPQDVIYSKNAENQEVQDKSTLLINESFECLERLETKMDKIISTLDFLIKNEFKSEFSTNYKVDHDERKEIVNELINMPSFMVKKRKELLTKLQDIV